jgi:hypothetical protein
VIEIHEPATLITDYALAALNSVLGLKLLGAAQSRNSVMLWAGGFIALALAAFLGGTWHGFSLNLDTATAGKLWKATLYATGIASFCILAGTAIAVTRGPGRSALLLLAAAKFVLYLFWVTLHDDFRFVVYDTGATMAAVFVLMGWGAARRAPGALRIAVGVLVSIVAATVQQIGLSLSAHFNHNDLYHVVQMGAMCVFYRGALRLQDGLR